MKAGSTVAKVLIVDDDIELATTIDAVLQQAHWITETAYNGADALQLLQNFAPVVVKHQLCF